MQLRNQAPEGPLPLSLSEPKLMGEENTHRMSSPLLERCLPFGQHLSGNRLSGSNWELHCGNSLALRLHLVSHAGTRACLYFLPENGGKLRRTVVTDGVSKLLDIMHHIHLFQS